LGWKKVGVIAQQIKLMNSLVRPNNSAFDLRRFWEHSVGCALIADRLVSENLIALPAQVNFNDYWISALLHDIGKLLLGFFFWGHFEEVLKQMTAERSTFREAEKELGDVGNHEYLAQILLLRSNATKEVVETVGKHHTTGPAPTSLVCLVHVANNLCTELGLGYLPDEPARYSETVLANLRATPEEMYRLRELLGKPMVLQIKEIVNRCAHA
jgi:HD-like signal output (HDOD) protein